MTKQEMIEKLAGMGLSLPEVAKAVGSYVPAVRSGTLVFVSGQLPIRDGRVQYTGDAGRPRDRRDRPAGGEAVRAQCGGGPGARGPAGSRTSPASCGWRCS